ncbi:MAG: hypothetical protein JJU41_03560 [Bacteroidetes bacterium]|nr:hypothetical protein [Bacteroidota bacterium]
MKSINSIIIVCLLLFLTFSGCELVSTEFQEMDFESLQTSTRVEEPMVVVFNDYESWSMFFRRHYSGIHHTEPPPAPAFDFDTHTLVGIFWGQQPSGCTHYANAVERVERRSNVIRITVGPLNDLGSCRMITYPQEYIHLPRRTRHVQFIGEVPGESN